MSQCAGCKDLVGENKRVANPSGTSIARVDYTGHKLGFFVRWRLSGGVVTLCFNLPEELEVSMRRFIAQTPTFDADHHTAAGRETRGQHGTRASGSWHQNFAAMFKPLFKDRQPRGILTSKGGLVSLTYLFTGRLSFSATNRRIAILRIIK